MCNDMKPVRPFWVALMAGGCAGTTVDVALFPIDTIKTRLQAPEGFLRAGGFKGVYNGLTSAAAGSAPGAAIFFCAYESAKTYLTRTVPEKYHSGCYIMASSVAETAACLVRVPTDNIKQKIQVRHVISAARS
jgi:solute carrier family 25 S-adenosylmethionine transporter 26